MTTRLEAPASRRGPASFSVTDEVPDQVRGPAGTAGLPPTAPPGGGNRPHPRPGTALRTSGARS